MSEIPALTNLEIVIMGVLWDQGKDLTIQEIAECLKEEKLSSASVTQVMKRLLKKKAVAVKERRPVANVYARSFVPCFGRESFISAEINRLEKKTSVRKRLSTVGMAAALLTFDSDEQITKEEMDELQEIINRKRAALKAEEK